MPQVSVIVPVYKVEKYLKRCVDSILAQTFTDFELILVDDGSPDGCPDMCDEYAEKDRRVRVIHKENGGLSSARNAGIDWVFENSDSEWISFVDSDDYVHPKMLESLLNAVVSLNVSVSVCSFYFNTDGNVPVCDEVASPVYVTPDELFMNLSALSQAAWNKFYRREVFNTLRYPVGKLCEDSFVAPEIIYSQERLAFVNSDLIYYTYNPEGITYSKWDPKKLDEVEVWHYQTEYMRKHGHMAAYEFVAKRYIREIERHYRFVENSPDHSSYLSFIKKEMRKALKDYGKLLGLRIQNEPAYYEIAYPVLSKAHRVARRVKSKLARLLGK